MVSANVDRVLQEVVALTLDERRELMSLLAVSQSPSYPPSDADLVDAALLEEGLLISIPARPTQDDMDSDNSFKPFEIDGRPISEILIEERR